MHLRGWHLVLRADCKDYRLWLQVAGDVCLAVSKPEFSISFKSNY
jgi:hypothetical protein